jgi:MoaA/NifB/PqqE/SkfB family radical SAM enzyme
MKSSAQPRPAGLRPGKFQDPDVTAKGERRAAVSLKTLDTLWFNTGTLCNLTCRSCYIESSPTNDRLVYISAAEVARFLDELDDGPWRAREIGLTGGEPLMNPEIAAIIGQGLSRGYRVLVLTNAMRPMMKQAEALLRLKEAHGDRLAIRVSIDHYAQALHETERGRHSWDRAIEGLVWLARNGFNLSIAGRTMWGEPEASLRAGYARLLRDLDIVLDTEDRERMVLFPEMDAEADVPEITEACWGILKVSPDAMMCANSRMVVKRKGAARPVVVSCTLLPYDPQFEMGETLAEAAGRVKLNHPHCARFCVLGGGSCSVAT